MSEPLPPRPEADRNLLFGILALQMDFIDRDALVAAMHGWVLEKSKPLGQILFEHGKLDPENLQLLNALVTAHLKAHGNDPEKVWRPSHRSARHGETCNRFAIRTCRPVWQWLVRPGTIPNQRVRCFAARPTALAP
jgi:hypothetical protein